MLQVKLDGESRQVHSGIVDMVSRGHVNGREVCELEAIPYNFISAALSLAVLRC